MSNPILTTKLFIPPSPSNLVLRPRLIEQLNHGLNHKLTLVSAPAGFGKTTLLSECARRCGLPAAWLSLDESDNELVQFLTYFVAALQTLEPALGVAAISVLQSSRPSAELILTSLINDIASSPETKMILVIDDYHVIESQEIDQAITFFIDHMPYKMHVVIAGRTDPTIPLPRLRSLDQLMELRIDDLRFTLEETATFLQSRMGLKLSAADIEALDRRTEGWVAGLQMAALSMKGLRTQDEISWFVRKFSSSHRFILDYLTDEVLRQRPEGTKDFLIQTSILERFCAGLCNAVTMMENCQDILETLESANLFIISLDNERKWYRYHHLFGELLRVRLERSAPNIILKLHRRASGWYAEEGAISEAIAHSLAAHDFERAAELTEQTFIDRMARGEDLMMMFSRLAAIPDEIIRAHPRLGVMYAWMLSLTLQLDQVEPRLADVEARFEGRLPADLQRQIAFIRAEVLRHQGDMQKSIQASLKILEHLPEEQTFTDQQTYTGLVTNLAWAYLIAGEIDLAQKWFVESLELGQHSMTLTLLGLFGLAFAQELRGGLHQAMETCQQGFDLIEDTTQKVNNEVPAEMYMHLRYGNLLRERGQLAEAEEHLMRGIELGRKWNSIGDTMRDGYLDLARLRRAQGDYPGALDVLHQAEKLQHHYRSVAGFGDAIAAHIASINLAWAASTGDSRRLSTVKRWLKRRNLQADGISRSINGEFEYLVWVRLLIFENQPELALRVLERLIVHAKSQNRIGRVIEMQLLQSLAYQAQRDTAAALKVLGAALTQAEPEGYVRLFVDEGQPVAGLLHQAAAKGIAPEYVDKLMASFDTQRAVRLQHRVQAYQSDPIEQLSDREFEVLRLLSDGCTNHEIAQELFIAVTTAKKHVSNIIGKLGVSNRTQAVARARQLELL